MSIYKKGWGLKRVMRQIRKHNLGRISKNKYGQCHYRNPDGNRCLVGCFIPDEKYDEHMEGKDVWGLLYSYNHLEDIMPMSKSALTELQNLHDGKKFDESNPENYYGSIEILLIAMEMNIDFSY